MHSPYAVPARFALLKKNGADLTYWLYLVQPYAVSSVLFNHVSAKSFLHPGVGATDTVGTR